MKITNDNEYNAALREKELIGLEFQKSIKGKVDIDIRVLPLHVVIETINSLKKEHKTYPRLQELEQACEHYNKGDSLLEKLDEFLKMK